MKSRNQHSFTAAGLRQRGSVLMAAMMTLVLFTVISAAILTYSTNSMKLATRKLRISQAKLSAGNDMEYLFYRWASALGDISSDPVQSRLYASGLGIVDAPANITATGPSTIQPFLADASVPALPIPTLNRTLEYVNLSAQGQVTNKASGITRSGTVKYWTAKVRYQITDPTLGTIEIHLGRRFTYQTISACNGAIYYQQNMEWGVGGNMDIYGDIECNGNIYMGSRGGTLTIHDNIYFGTTFNGASDAITGSQHTIDPNPPATVPSYADPTFADSRANQVIKMSGPDNMLGFNDPNDPTTDPAYIAAHFPSAYPDGANDVYRALIAPPPTDSSGNVVAEDPRVAASRTYNKAGLLITIGSGGAVTVSAPGVVGDPTNGQLAAAITAIRSPVYDQREGKNVNMTTIDMAQLTTILQNVQQTNNGAWKFNGVLYVNDQNPANTTTPDLNGIRVINASATPNFDYSSSSPDTGTGFTLCTNNGLYIQGDFNTAQNPNTHTTNRAAVMADAVTVLSAGWNDAQATSALSARPASADIVINSAILSGNTPTQPDASGNYTYDSAGRMQNSSGGVQNLVRYLEDWYYTSHNSVLKGSLVQLFYSKYFNSKFKPSGVADNVYLQPISRQLVFDSALASNPPNGVPASVTKYYRGDLFEW